MVTFGARSSPLAKQDNCSNPGCMWQKMSQEQHWASGLQSMRLEVKGAHSRVSRGVMDTDPRADYKGQRRFPAEQNPEAQELEVNESLWGAQLQAEGIRWTRLLQSYSPCPTLHLNHPALSTDVGIPQNFSFCGCTSLPTVT